MMGVKHIRFKRHVIWYEILCIVLVFVFLPSLLYEIYFPRGITANANTAFWVFGTIAAAFTTLLGLLVLVVSNMMWNLDKMLDNLKKFFEPTPLTSKNLDRLSANIEEVFKYKTSVLISWFKNLWASFIFLIVYCLIMIFGTGTWFKGELDPIFLFVAVWWASLNLYLFYRIINVYLREMAESIFAPKKA